MEFDALRAAVVPGAAVVGRWPGIVCVAECADRQVLRHLLDVCAAAAGPEPGRALARRLTMWLGSPDAPTEGLRFGTVAVAGGDTRSGAFRGEQWAVFLYGPVGLVVPDRQVALSGAQAVAWTDRLLPRPDVPVVLALEGGPIPPGVIDGVHDLRSGVVPGAGAVLVPGGDGLAADTDEETARHRPDDPIWGDNGERERPRWGGPAPEPALAAPSDGLFHAGEGPGGGPQSRAALEDLAPDPGPEMAGEQVTDRTRIGDRGGRAHLRPVPSGSNGIGHRGRGTRRAPTFDLGRFGGGPGRGRDAAGPGVGDAGGRGVRPGGDPADGQDESGPPGSGRSEPITDERPAVRRDDTDPYTDTAAVPGVGAPGSDVNDTGVNGVARTNGVAPDPLGIPDDLSSLDSALDVPLGDLPRREPGHLNGNALLDGTGLNGTGLNGSGLDGTGLNGPDFTGTGLGSTGINGTGLNGDGRIGHDGAGLPLEPGTGPWGDPDGAGDARGPGPLDGHWFAPRSGDQGTETQLSPLPAPDERRPRHGRQESGLPAEPAEPAERAEPGDPDDATAGTPRFGVHTVPPSATIPAVAPAVPPALAPAPLPEPDDRPPTVPAPLRAEAVHGTPPVEPPRAPLEAGRPATAAAGAPADPLDDSQVRGHLCSRGHFNDPRVSACAFCGSPLEENTGPLVAGPRPALGLLVFDDGATYTVDAAYLVGRMPEGDPRVAAGALRSLSVEDPSGAVSRVHAEVRLAGWDVLLTDVGSRNGTFVSGPGEPDWTQLPAGQTHRLVPGTRVRLGGRSFLFESPSGAR